MVFEAYCKEGVPFWNRNLTWDTRYLEGVKGLPDFTSCFEETVLAWIPTVFLLVFLPSELYTVYKKHTKLGNSISNDRKNLWSPLLIVKTLLSISLIITQLLLIVHHVALRDEADTVYDIEKYTPAIRAVTFGLVIFISILNKRYGLYSKAVQWMYWFILGLCEAFRFRTIINAGTDGIHSFEYTIEMIFYPLILIQLVLESFADIPNAAEEGKSTKIPCPEPRASFLARILFFWFDGLGWKGYRNPLEYSDLWDLNDEDKSDALVPQYQKYWDESVEKSKRDSSDKETSVLPPLIKFFGPSFLFGVLTKLIHDLLQFAAPLLLQQLIAHIENEDEETWKGYFYGALLFLAAMLQTMVLAQYFHRMFVIGMRVRSTLTSVLYRKALSMSSSARKDFTVGEIVNLMSVDTQRFMDTLAYVNMIWSGPLQIIICLYLLWNTLGPSVLAGVGVMVLMIPLNAVIVSKSRGLQIKQMKAKDERVKLMNEILSGIKVLKLYAWEPSFEKQVMDIREKENKLLKSAAYLASLVSFIWQCAPFLVSLLTFATYVLIDEANVLDAQKAFVSLTLFNIMRMPLTVLPQVITTLVQMSVSLKRINKFLNCEDIDPEAVGHDKSEADPLVIENGNFGWEPESLTLKNINLRVKAGSLVAIVGSVGSGKSSLLAAVLGELEKKNGKVNRNGTIAHVAQQAWIQNDTLKNNILFGQKFDTRKYNRVIEACALRPDLSILPAGDSTEIGEKGINLSGGQKQRVSLARAVYHESEMYLLDDPLSAVDSHVGKLIFDNVIGPNGMLAKKTRLFVTHGITYLPQTDNIIVIKDGEISECGSYNELLQRKGAFSDFLIQHLGEQEGDDAIDDETTNKILRDLEGVVGKDALARQISRISESSAVLSGESGKTRQRGESESDSVSGLLRRQTSVTSTGNDIGMRRLSSSQSPQRGDGGSLRRKQSTVSSLGDEKAGLLQQSKPQDKLIEIEKAETGSVKFGVYLYYLKSLGWRLSFWALLLHLIYQGFQVYSSFWLSNWSNAAKPNETMSDSDRNMYLGVYGGLGLGQAIAIMLGSITIGLATVQGSSYLHAAMLRRVFRSPMSFFDTTPSGRIVNRFAKDVDTTDNILPMNLRTLLLCLLNVVSTIGVISYSTPIFLSVIVPTGIVYYMIQRFYVATSRQLKRLESISRSPIYSHFGETVTGALTIRAYSMQNHFIQESESKVDHNQMAYFPSIVSNRWLAVRLETIGNLLILFAALFAVIGRGNIDAGTAGLSISYALQITQVLNWLVRMTSDAETNVVSVERIKEYVELQQEAEWEIEEHKPKPEWPEKGTITFEHYQSRYREGLDLVLKNVTCTIQPGEKVGIVGRTGAGKSSLTLGLFRIVEAAGGYIEIDGQNIAKLGLHDIRGRLTIIPQDPVLFSGSLRLNLDPFSRYSDDALWRALELSHLKDFIQTLSSGLEHVVSEGGENFSIGQRQLICLARSMLRRKTILVLDEATASIDLETDDLIQQTIRTEFADSTVLTIAHRLNTIMDSTRVMVLDKGEIVEFDPPQVLLQNQKSIFYGMAKDAGLV